VPLTFHLTVAAGVVTGTVEGLPTTPAEIHDGRVEGDTVTFWVNTDYEGTAYKLVYKGKVAADGIKFTFGTEEGSWGAELDGNEEYLGSGFSFCVPRRANSLITRLQFVRHRPGCGTVCTRPRLYSPIFYF